MLFRVDIFSVSEYTAEQSGEIHVHAFVLFIALYRIVTGECEVLGRHVILGDHTKLIGCVILDLGKVLFSAE